MNYLIALNIITILYVFFTGLAQRKINSALIKFSETSLDNFRLIDGMLENHKYAILEIKETIAELKDKHEHNEANREDSTDGSREERGEHSTDQGDRRDNFGSMCQ